MESVIKDKLVNHVINDDLFCNAQHGFVPRPSCMNRERWTELLDGGNSVDVIYPYLRKTFDTVPHRRLIKKLEA